MEQDKHVVVGHRQGWGEDPAFGMDAISRRQHVYVIGQTGAGKSTLLRNLILQDIEEGRGVALIDPHGDLASDVLEHIPPCRTGDVVYFNPASRDPLAINLFRATSLVNQVAKRTAWSTLAREVGISESELRQPAYDSRYWWCYYPSRC